MGSLFLVYSSSVYFLKFPPPTVKNTAEIRSAPLILEANNFQQSKSTHSCLPGVKMRTTTHPRANGIYILRRIPVRQEGIQGIRNKFHIACFPLHLILSALLSDRFPVPLNQEENYLCGNPSSIFDSLLPPEIQYLSPIKHTQVTPHFLRDDSGQSEIASSQLVLRQGLSPSRRGGVITPHISRSYPPELVEISAQAFTSCCASRAQGIPIPRITSRHWRPHVHIEVNADCVRQAI